MTELLETQVPGGPPHPAVKVSVLIVLDLGLESVNAKQSFR